ncbi:MAG: cobyrinate a,c-diamide synthase [Desulfobacterales bacterium]|nr:cobyrinate a,c-diamide synthase [Desulfobacterales bacterium]
MKGFIIAGIKSGSGKTTITLGILAALFKKGITVSVFKVGPDFIDPGHHSHIIKKPSRNIDGWMLSRDYNYRCFALNSANCDVAVVEGVMGLFDGYDGKSEDGSTAQIAKWLNLPVVLIVDAKSMARSVAAIIKGFEEFDKDLKFAGVIFNNVASERHLNYLKDSLAGNVNMPFIGGIAYDDKISIPERHLGLVTSEDNPLSAETINNLSYIIEKNILIERLLNILPDINVITPCTLDLISPKVRIGVAKDRAFCFYYQDNIDFLNLFGGEIVYFSPISDCSLPENLDGIYLGGGYPELFLEELYNNKSLMNQIKEKSNEGIPIYAECGGFMYLCNSICKEDGKAYEMAGCFPFGIKMLPRLKALGYREITLLKDTIIGKKGSKIRGHEFHYSEIVKNNGAVETVYNVSTKANINDIFEGYQISRTIGSYIHLHFGSCPDSVKTFIDSCILYKKEMRKNNET